MIIHQSYFFTLKRLFSQEVNEMTYIIFKLSDTCVIANTCRRLPSFQPWSLVTIFKCEKNNEVDKTA